MNILLLLMVSLCFVEFVHNLLEIWGMRQKVEWLDLSLKGKMHGRWPIHINTKFKTVLLHTAIFLLITTLAYSMLSFLHFGDESLLTIGIAVLLVNYIVTTWNIDSFHTEIGKLIKRAKERKD